VRDVKPGKSSHCSTCLLTDWILVPATDARLFGTRLSTSTYFSSHFELCFFTVYAVFFLPIDVSMLPTAQMKANVANAPRVMTMGFLYPAVQG
jgi:hypothetical protein